jgi:ribosomal protein S27E
MRFRNSGKLDLSGKNVEYILAGVLLVVIVAAVVLSLGSIRCSGPSFELPDSYRVKCVECDEEWEIKPDEAMDFGREVREELIGVDCDKCGEKECVFLMIQCPKCKKHYLSKSIADPDAFVEDKHKDICPHCGTDMHKWYKDRR